MQPTQQPAVQAGRARRVWRRVDGVLLLDKPSGLSSNAALQRARRVFQAEKGGHTGTLDPLASGLLPLCFGEATKFAQFLLDADKAYRATIRFGVATDTLDAEGAVVATRPVVLDADGLAALLAAATGSQMQTPPAHAALKYRGRAYYEYARAGEDIPREPRAVTVTRLDLVDWRVPDAVVDVVCSKGTYVRVIAADLGARAGCGAHLAALRRTRTGGFDVAQATALDRLEQLDERACAALLLPPDALVASLARADLVPADAGRLLLGQPVAHADARDGALWRCYAAGSANAAASFLGVAEAREGMLRPRRLVNAAAVAPA